MKIVKYRNGNFELEDGTKIKSHVFNPKACVGMEIEDVEKLYSSTDSIEGMKALVDNNK